MLLKIGVTGTRNGMTEFQYDSVKEFLISVKLCGEYENLQEFHHGDCIGVDVDVAAMAAELGYKTVNHPPIDDSLRGFHESDVILEPHSYFARNRNIVNSTDLLIVVPREDSHQPKGGTWYTHDYAVKVNKPVRVFYPAKKD